MASADFSIAGDKELMRQLKRLENKTGKKYIRKSMREGAKVIQKAAKENAPVKTGKLKKGIEVRAGKRSQSNYTVNVQTKPRQYFGIDPSDRFYYPAIVEYTSKSYLRKAADEKRTQAINKIAQFLRTQVKL